MSQETIEWLNTQCLIGFTDKRGKAWHYKESAQGTEPNHYPGAIPVEEIQRRLFNFTAQQVPVFVADPRPGFGYLEVPNKQAIQASDDGSVFGVFSDGYLPHQYSEWLIDNVSTILDDDLGIGSALLLKNRGVAVVQVEVPENFVTPDGVEFRPNLLAATSLNGTLATVYKRTVTVAVCDNTTEWALAEEGQEVRIRHSKYSGLRIGEARDTLALIFDQADAFTAEVNRLCAVSVSEREWNQVLEALVPVPEEEGRSQTLAVNKRDQLKGLWASDPRVEPWGGTAFGVSQAFNTWNQHLKTVRGAHQVERTYTNALSGATGRDDAAVFAALSGIKGFPVLVPA